MLGWYLRLKRGKEESGGVAEGVVTVVHEYLQHCLLQRKMFLRNGIYICM
ncbi:hypothetical protein WN55_08657 [Dufourea novaeangliae]|uniref:Uncharacterized protein n=1 Tax=Dufourea novaeangliae TaxID=178035 RepID=A0A154NZP2_DUFNO|nr:hypothetical protein WN55_08657 [Dufourea novaeangliae]